MDQPVARHPDAVGAFQVVDMTRSACAPVSPALRRSRAARIRSFSSTSRSLARSGRQLIRRNVGPAHLLQEPAGRIFGVVEFIQFAWAWSCEVVTKA